METESEQSPSSSSTGKQASASPRRPSRRRWLQFRLRTLLVVLTLCGLGFGLIFSSSRRRHEAEMQALTTLGATYYSSSLMEAWNVLSKGKPLAREDDSKPERKDDSSPDRVNATVDIPDWLKSVPGLARDGIFSGVTRLSIGHRDKIARLTPEEKSSLDSLSSLQALAIDGFLLDRADMERLARYPHLFHLSLPGCTFDPGAFEPVGNLHGLTWLDLNGSSVKDDDLPALARLSNLRILFLSHTEVSDRGLAHLHGMTGLRRIDLSGSRVTDEGVDKLREAIPGLQLLDD